VHSLGTDLILTHSGYRRYLNWLVREKLFCFSCGKEIHAGDQIHRSGKVLVFHNQWDESPSGNGACRFYHAVCYDELFIEC
jgi:hypothetical protein